MALHRTRVPRHLEELSEQEATGNLHRVDLQSWTTVTDCGLTGAGGHKQHDRLGGAQQLVVHLVATASRRRVAVRSAVKNQRACSDVPSGDPHLDALDSKVQHLVGCRVDEGEVDPGQTGEDELLRNLVDQGDAETFLQVDQNLVMPHERTTTNRCSSKSDCDSQHWYRCHYWYRYQCISSDDH